MKFHELSDRMTTELRRVLRGVNERDVKCLEREIQRGKPIFVTGAGRTSILFRPFAMRLMQYGFESHVVGETTTPKVNPGDLVIVGSGSGNTEGVNLRAQEAKSLGARVFVITGKSDAPLLKWADSSIVIPPPKGGSFQFGRNWFEQAFFVLLECVAHRLARAKNVTFEKLLSRHASLE